MQPEHCQCCQAPHCLCDMSLQEGRCTTGRGWGQDRALGRDSFVRLAAAALRERSLQHRARLCKGVARAWAVAPPLPPNPQVSQQPVRALLVCGKGPLGQAAHHACADTFAHVLQRGCRGGAAAAAAAVVRPQSTRWSAARCMARSLRSAGAAACTCAAMLLGWESRSLPSKGSLPSP